MSDQGSPSPKAAWAWLVEAALWAALLALLGLAWAYHSFQIEFPHQLHGTEGGMLQSVRALLMGKSPWTLANAYDYANNYGIGMPWLAAKLSLWAPGVNLLVLMRRIAAAAAFAGLGLIFLHLRDGAVGALEAMAACAVIYAGLLYFDTLAAHPDGLAFFFYIAASVCALRLGRANAFVAGVLAVLGFFTKPYALLAVPVGLVLLAATDRRRDAPWLLAGALLSGAILGGTIHAWAPEYFFMTVSLTRHSMHYDPFHLWHQLWQMAADHWPLLAACAGGAGWARKGGRWPRLNALERAWALAALAVFVILALGPGGNRGAFLRYYEQLFVPVALIAALAWMTRAGIPRQIRVAVLLLDALVMLRFDRRSYPLISDPHLADWNRIEAWVAEHPYGLYPPMFVSIEAEAGAWVYENDHNSCITLYAPPSPMLEVALARKAAAEADLKAGRFQSVVLSFEDPSLEAGPRRLYHLAEPLCAYAPTGFKCYAVYERIGMKKARAADPGLDALWRAQWR